MSITNINGTVSGTNSAHHKIYLECNETATSVASNTSTITVKLKLTSDGNGKSYKSNVPYTVTINGTKYTGTFNLDTRGATQTDTLVTIANKTITHSGDGSKSISVSASFSTGLSGLSSASVSGTWKLSNIPRASSISSVTSNVTVNGTNKVTINISRKSSSFTHDVVITFGGKSHTVTGVGTSTSYAIPTSWLNEIPNSTTGKATVKVTTKNGSSAVGSTVSTTFTITVPSYKPTAEITINKENTVATLESWGWVSGRCKAVISGSGTSSYGATIQSYKITGPDVNSTSNKVTTPVLSAGTKIYTVTVKDSRGFSASKPLGIIVTPYNAPTISKVTATRPSNDSTVSLSITYSCDPFTDNVAKCKVEYKESLATTWTTWSSSVASGSVLTGTLNSEKTYVIRFTVTDKYKTSTVTKTISTVMVTMDLRNGGNGISFGKVAEVNGYMDVGFHGIFRKNIFMGQYDDLEHNIFFYNTCTTGNHHKCKLYGGNAESIVGIACYDSLNSRSIWRYLDGTNQLVFGPNTVTDGTATFNNWVKSPKFIGDAYRLKDGLGNEKACISAVDGTVDGIGLLLTSGGLTVVGSGESPANYVEKYKYTGQTEQLHLTSDHNITFAVRCNVIDDVNRIILNTSGYFYPEVGGGFSIGHTNYRFANGFFNAVYNSSGAITTSDRRYKNTEMGIDDKFNDLFDLVPVKTFKYNDGNSGRTHTGIIAQDMLDSMEALGISTTDFGCVVEDFDDDGNSYYGVRYDEYQMLTAARLKKEISEHNKTKEKLQALEERFGLLEQRLNSLCA